MITAGIDVAKARLTCAIDGLAEWAETGNDAAGWRELRAWLADHGVVRVGLEATGGYERGVAADLARAGLEVRILDPAGARAFARSMAVRAKNDRIDAGMIARYAASVRAREREADPRIEVLREEMRFLEQLEEDRARWKTRAETYGAPRLKSQAATRVRRLKAEIGERVSRIEDRLRAHPDLARRLDLVLSIPGIGRRTALAMLIHIPELGHLGRNQAAALVGVAPYDHDSGAFRGRRRVAGGRPRLRRAPNTGRDLVSVEVDQPEEGVIGKDHINPGPEPITR